MNALRLLIWHECRLTSEVIATSLGTATETASMLIVDDLHALGQEASRRGSCVAIVAGDIGPDVLEVTAEVQTQAPRCHIVLVATQPTPVIIDRALQAGQISVVSHNAGIAHLVHAVRGAANGCPTIDLGAATTLREPMASPLSRREREVLILTASGHPIKDIAQRLCLTPGTVRNVSSSAIRKASARNRFEAARLASAHGWL